MLFGVMVHAKPYLKEMYPAEGLCPGKDSVPRSVVACKRGLALLLVRDSPPASSLAGRGAPAGPSPSLKLRCRRPRFLSRQLCTMQHGVLRNVLHVSGFLPIRS